MSSISQFITSALLKVLIFIYQSISFHDLGIAIILLTILVRLVLLPFFYKSAKDQAVMQRIQPLILAIQKEHKNNKEKQAEALMELYKKHKINPFSSMFLLLLQLPIFWGLFNIFTNQIKNTAFTGTTFLGLFDLSSKNFLIVFIAATLQYLQTRVAMGKQPPGKQAQMQNVVALVGPIITILIFSNLPSAIALYWLAFNIFSLIQQIFINKKLPTLEKEVVIDNNKR